MGFDQLLAVVEPKRRGSVAGYLIWNSDGSAAQQCGNGARCVAAWLVRDGAATAGTRFTLDSPAGPIEVECLPDGRYALDMGKPDFVPAHIPFRSAEQRAKYDWREREATLRFGVRRIGGDVVQFQRVALQIKQPRRRHEVRPAGGVVAFGSFALETADQLVPVRPYRVVIVDVNAVHLIADGRLRFAA